jgi:hypothetical protein
MGGNIETESTKARNRALPRMGSFASEKAASEPTKRDSTVDEVATTRLFIIILKKGCSSNTAT